MHDFFIKGHYEAFLDGEMCVLDDRGTSQFNEGIAFRSHCKSSESINRAMSEYPVTFVVFDILELDGTDLRAKPYEFRRKVLENLDVKHSNVQICEVFSDINDGWDKVTSRDGEGLILKHKNSIYREGYRSGNWKKVKNIKELDVSFDRFEVNNQGITVENQEGIRVLVAGRHQHEVRKLLTQKGEATLTIRHLGITKAGKLRQPTYMKVVN